MSQEALVALRAANSLANTLTFDQLAAYHVPFDELAGTLGVESEVRYLSSHQGRIALIGESGAGKSSILAGELGAFSESVPEHLVPIRIPVALGGLAEVTDVKEFGRHLVNFVLREAAPETFDDGERGRLRALTAETVTDVGRRPRGGFAIGTSDLLPFHAELSGDLAGAAKDFEHRLQSGEVVGAMKRLVTLFRGRGLEPFLIFDDTDSWLQFPDRAEEARKRAEGFFGNNVRVLTRELDCGFAVAVHRSYLELSAYRQVADSLEHVEVPELADPPAALAVILQRRMDVDELGIAVADAFDGAAIGELGSLYAAAPDLRRIMGIAGLAVRMAYDDADVEVVTPEAVALARAERDPLRAG